MLFLLLISLILCSSSLYLLFFLRSCRLNRRTLGLLPPGNFGFPLIGETLQLISAYKTENPEPFIDSRVSKYGNLFTTHVFGEPTVFSTEPETNRFVLHNEGKLFESSYHSSISNLLGKHSLSLMKGNLHKRMHSLAVSFANSSTIRDNLFVCIDELIRFNLDSWTDQVLLHEEAKKITFELTVKQLMSHDPGQWTDNLRREYLLLIDGFFSVPFPFFFTTYGRAIKARKKIAETLRSTVRKRRKECEKDDKMRQKDMLGALVHDEDGLSDKQIVDFLLSLLVAGHETTSTVMTLAVKFVTETPLALAQLKEEHDEIRRKNHNSEALQWSDYKSMAFTQCIINETLRVANIISGVFRRATTDVNIKGFTIPKGWKVFTSFRAVHLDEHNYKEARTFNPWRWQNNSASSSSHGNMFTPFGGGPRLCPGYELARVEISVFLHHFITNFSWTAEEDKLVFFPTTRTLKRYPIHVYRRKKLKV